MTFTHRQYWLMYFYGYIHRYKPSMKITEWLTQNIIQWLSLDLGRKGNTSREKGISNTLLPSLCD